MWKKLIVPLRRASALLNRMKIPVVPTGIVMLNTAHLLDIEHNLDEKGVHFENPYPLKDSDFYNYDLELRHIGEKNQEAMQNLIRTLNCCIEEICEQYQICVVKQIEITLSCMALDPVGPHWDDLTRYRVEADDLKDEFLKYSMLVERIGQILEGCGYSAESESKKLDVVATEYKQLKVLIDQKINENKYWDSKLLDVNTESILLGAHK